ncbi:hypothetical protein [Chamaesiphon sp.]|uniref:hypothetical protein n=1 Tax=Chamaesiphon sp. TaxID=2814140 RepID=UPI003593C24D
MKRLSLTGLSIIAIVLSVSTSAQARGHQEVRIQPMIKISKNIPTSKYITPFELVGSAYQGQYRDHSIPGFRALIYGTRIGRITAKDLVKAAIESKELLPEMIDDRSYLSNVESQLRSLGR